MKIKIRSIEKYLPGEKISSSSLDKIADIPQGRIEKNTGVKFRYHAPTTESVCEMGAKALQKSLITAELNASDIDFLIFTGGSFDYPIPSNSVVIKSKITDDSIIFPCIDIDSTCLSFINGLDIAHLYLETKRYKRIAIVCSEMSSRALNPKDEKTFGLLGDAAVAMIIEYSENDFGYESKYVNFVNYPSGAMLANVQIGGAINRGRYENFDNPGYFFQMDGKKLIRLIQKYLGEFIKTMEDSSKLKLTDFEHIIAHQTSKFGMEYFLKTFNLDKTKIVETLSDYGNCISASIPLGLEKIFNDKNISLQNKNILLIGTASGLSIGSMILKF